MLIQKQETIRDRDYLDSYNGCNCFACGSDYGVVGAHIRPGSKAGTGRKPSDALTLALCFYCHAKEGGGPKKFWNDLGWSIDQVKEIARERYREWKNG